MVTSFFTGFGLWDYLQQIKTRTEALNSELQIMSNRLSETLVLPVWAFDITNISDTISAEMSNKNIITITVYESISEEILITKTRDANWNIVDINEEPIPVQIIEQKDIVYIDRPIAFLKVEATDKFIKEDITAAAMNQAVRILILIIIFIILLSITIFFAVLKPIKSLMLTIRNIKEGNINEEIYIKRDDELGELASNFSNMRDTIKLKIESLNVEIIERKKIEDKLNNLQNYLTNIIDSMPSVLVGVNSEGKVTLWNKTAEQTTGVSATEATGKNLIDVFPVMATEMEKITESIRTREVCKEQKQPRHSDYGTLYEDITIYPLISNGVKGAVIRVDDITEIIRMEEMMIQSEKMLSVGGLAAGMAHEINNPLAGMMQTANVMKNRLGDKFDSNANQKAADKIGVSLESIRDFMEERGIIRMTQVIRESGDRIADIVSNILSFARKSDSQRSTIELPSIIDRTLELAATDYDLKKHYDFKLIEIQKEYEENIYPVPCEGSKIQQVLLNIFQNGAQAMEKAEIKNPRFIIRLYSEYKAQKMICLEIEDNGPGMNEEIRKRIFEPFFTTKPVGVGTGLGLSVSYFIITENHQGEMIVKSTPGNGATFIIKLPVG